MHGHAAEHAVAQLIRGVLQVDLDSHRPVRRIERIADSRDLGVKFLAGQGVQVDGRRIAGIGVGNLALGHFHHDAHFVGAGDDQNWLSAPLIGRANEVPHMESSLGDHAQVGRANFQVVDKDLGFRQFGFRDLYFGFGIGKIGGGFRDLGRFGRDLGIGRCNRRLGCLFGLDGRLELP